MELNQILELLESRIIYLARHGSGVWTVYQTLLLEGYGETEDDRNLLYDAVRSTIDGSIL